MVSFYPSQAAARSIALDPTRGGPAPQLVTSSGVAPAFNKTRATATVFLGLKIGIKRQTLENSPAEVVVSSYISPVPENQVYHLQVVLCGCPEKNW